MLAVKNIFEKACHATGEINIVLRPVNLKGLNTFFIEDISEKV